jgi:hypothetical protein
MQTTVHRPQTTEHSPQAAGAALAATGADQAYWILRVGAALCFIGHGAFGFLTKAAWVPYFGVVGIPESWAWRLMPAVGALDVVAGMAVLFAPRGLPLVYMAIWATWTALLRPLSGEPFYETIERAGNFGVPIALMLLAGMPRSLRGILGPLSGPSSDARAVSLAHDALKWTTCLLLVGHGALSALTQKAMLTGHYASIGLPASATALVGWFEIALGAAIAIRPLAGLLIFAAAWKLGTESLFIVTGAPIWEFVERAGSYAAPLALLALRGRR